MFSYSYPISVTFQFLSKVFDFFVTNKLKFKTSKIFKILQETAENRVNESKLKDSFLASPSSDQNPKSPDSEKNPKSPDSEKNPKSPDSEKRPKREVKTPTKFQEMEVLDVQSSSESEEDIPLKQSKSKMLLKMDQK